MSKIIYCGIAAEKICKDILAKSESGKVTYPLFIGSAGYWLDKSGIWVAYDNADGNCWIEEFKTKAAAKAWAEGQDRCLWINVRIS